MGERLINPLLNIQKNKRYKQMIFINPYRFGNINDNVFLALVDSLWSNPDNWSKGVVPTSTQNAIIRADCFLNVSQTVAKLIVEPNYTLTGDNTGRTLVISGQCKVDGTLNLAGSYHDIILRGTDNSIANLIAGFTSTITYDGAGDQDILPLDYYGLVVIVGTGTKRLIGDTKVSGPTIISGIDRTVSNFDLANYNAEFVGNFSLGAATFRRTGHGNVVFKGNYNSYTYTANTDFSSNSSTDIIEFQNGFSLVNTIFDLGESTVKFSTNDQNINIGDLHLFKNVEIVGDISVTHIANSRGSFHNVSGTSVNSKFINKGTLFYTNNVFPVMATGSLDLTNSGNTFVLAYEGDTVIPDLNYKGFAIAGSGVKSLSSDLIIEEDFGGYGNGHTYTILDLSDYNFTVNGTTFGASIRWTRTGHGNTIFKGFFSGYTYSMGFDFSSNISTDIIEFQNGFSLAFIPYDTTGNGVFGDTTVRFTQNKQTVGMNDYASLKHVFIDNDIEVTIAENFGFYPSLDITGGNVNSKLIIPAGARLHWEKQDFSMPVGELILQPDCDLTYDYVGDGSILGLAYRALKFNSIGIFRVVALEGDVTVPAANYVVAYNVTIDTNGYTLTTI